MLAITTKKGPYVRVRASGRLTREDYSQLLPELESLIREQGKLRLLIELHDLEGVEPAGLLDELKFDFKHRNDFSRIAVMGDSTLANIGTHLARPFFGGETRYFDRNHSTDAETWVTN